jgi:hypothetical protein
VHNLKAAFGKRPPALKVNKGKKGSINEEEK